MAEITQTPFAPLGGTGTPGDTNLEAMFGGSYTPSPTARARESLAALQEKQSSFMPTFLATAAALSGNFGPAIQLQEQKRRTAIGTAILPQLAQIQELQSNRKWEEAQALTEQLGMSIGPRAPEMVPLFQQIMQKNAKQMEDFKQNESLVNYLESLPIGSDKNHPNYKTFQAFKKEVKNRGAFTESIRANILSSMRLHTQNVNNQLIQTSEVTGDYSARPMPQIMSEKDIPAHSGGKISERYGISKAQIADVINNVDAPVEMQGHSIPLGHPLREQLKRDFYGLQGKEADFTIAPLIPIEPVLSTQLQSQGLAGSDIAARNISPEQAQQALQGQLGRRIQEVVAPALTQIYEDPFNATKAGVTYTDPKTGRRNPVMSYRDFLARQGGIVPTKEEDARQIVEPVFRSREALRYLPEMFKAFGYVDKPFSTLGKRMQEEIGQRLKIPLGPNSTAGQAMKEVIERALNEAEDTKLINSVEVARLKAMMTGNLASPEQSLEAANIILQRLDERLGRVVGAENVTPMTLDPASVIPGTPESQRTGAGNKPIPVTPKIDLRDKEYLKKLKVGD